MFKIYSILTFTLITNRDLLLPSKFGYPVRGETRLHSLQLPRISNHNLQLPTRTGSDLHVIPRKRVFPTTIKDLPVSVPSRSTTAGPLRTSAHVSRWVFKSHSSWVKAGGSEGRYPC